MEYLDEGVQRQRFATYLRTRPKVEQKQLQSAIDLATQSHAGQEHVPGTPYILHPLRAALSLIMEFGFTDPTIIVATLLHDAIEDTSVTYEQIETAFGKRVARIVENVTRQRPPDETDEEKRASKRAKLTWILDQDHETRLVKSADLLDNVRAWSHLPSDTPLLQKLGRWYREADELYLRIAERTDPRIASAMQIAIDAAKQVYADPSLHTRKR